MITVQELKIINDILEKNFDVEIQHRKNGLVILRSEKEVCCKKDNKSDKKSSVKGTGEAT